MKDEIQDGYADFGKALKDGWRSEFCQEKAKEVALLAHEWCSSQDREELTSHVSGKNYFRLSGSNFKTRAVNESLWIKDAGCFEDVLGKLVDIRSQAIDATKFNQCLYTASVGFSCAQDAFGDSRKKPGTFFEYLIRYVFSNFFNVAAQTSLPIRSIEEGETESLKVDLTFDLGSKKPKFIVPAKTSTRERIIQVWAHQRIIDGVFGMGRYRGLPVFLGETKTDKKKGEVVEICTPLQLKLQNWYVARMWQVVYLDVPEKYANLRGDEDDFMISSLGELLADGGRLRKLVRRFSGV